MSKASISQSFLQTLQLQNLKIAIAQNETKTHLDGLEPCDPDKGTFFGRFDVSWGGNGTPNSRLIDWLGASTNPNTMDCMVHPFIEGPEVLCTDPETYTLINNMPCAKTVTWRVEPANLFASPSNGNGVTASLWGNATSSGPISAASLRRG